MKEFNLGLWFHVVGVYDGGGKAWQQAVRAAAET